MKIVLINGSPRKNCNSAQLLDACTTGIKLEAPESELKVVNVYDYNFSGCKSCFACQMTVNREKLNCYVKDEIHDILEETRYADGIVIASPVYFLDISAQTKCFLERLNYPGPTEKAVPSTFIYSMNANAEQFKDFNIDTYLSTSRWYMENNFKSKPETVYAYDTYQFTDRENLNENFKWRNAEKLARRELHFEEDLSAACHAGKKLVERIRKVENQ